MHLSLAKPFYNTVINDPKNGRNGGNVSRIRPILAHGIVFQPIHIDVKISRQHKRVFTGIRYGSKHGKLLAHSRSINAEMRVVVSIQLTVLFVFLDCKGYHSALVARMAIKAATPRI